MPKYEDKQNFSFLSIPEVGEKERAEATWTKNLSTKNVQS